MQLEKGVEILNQTEIMEYNYGKALIIGFTSMVLIMIIFGVIYWFSDIYAMNFIGTIVSIVVFVFVTGSIAKATPTGKYQYQVTVDDSVSLNDFYEKYYIIKQEGKIYTIELKEDAEDIE